MSCYLVRHFHVLQFHVLQFHVRHFQRPRHVARGSAGQLALTVLEGSMEGTRCQGKPRRRWLNDRRLDGVQVGLHSAKGDVSGQRAMEEKDTGIVSCCRQPSEEEGRLEREGVGERECMLRFLALHCATIMIIGELRW